MAPIFGIQIQFLARGIMSTTRAYATWHGHFELCFVTPRTEHKALTGTLDTLTAGTYFPMTALKYVDHTYDQHESMINNRQGGTWNFQRVPCQKCDSHVLFIFVHRDTIQSGFLWHEPILLPKWTTTHHIYELLTTYPRTPRVTRFIIRCNFKLTVRIPCIKWRLFGSFRKPSPSDQITISTRTRVDYFTANQKFARPETLFVQFCPPKKMARVVLSSYYASPPIFVCFVRSTEQTCILCVPSCCGSTTWYGATSFANF